MRSLVLVVLVVIAQLVGGGGRTSAEPLAALATATQMQLTQNEMRYATGAPTVPAPAALVAAAQNHAAYSAINGTSGRVSVVGDFAYDFGMATVDLVRSPARGQSGVATSWNGRESPSPVPAGTSAPYIAPQEFERLGMPKA